MGTSAGKRCGRASVKGFLAAALALTLSVSGVASADENGARGGVLPGGTSSVGIAQEALGRHTVEGISPAGTTINLFDYWLDEHNTPDGKAWENSQKNGVADMGVNKNVGLKFRYNDNGPGINGASKWTKSASPNQGLVNGRLGGEEPFKKGFPTLTGKGAGGHQGESLSYLFNEYDFINRPAWGTDYAQGEYNPKFQTAIEHKAAFMGAGNLLQVDEQGYFYYDSTKNFAEFDEGSNRFILYDAPAVGEMTDAGKIDVTGQFFPFNTGGQVFADESADGSLVADATIDSRDSAMLNHYFGLSMETNFVQVNGGRVAEGGAPVVYEFSGDDDVWVFIDGVLVGDLGGIHNKSSLKIDFSTGKVVINEGIKGHEQDTTIRECFKKAGAQWTNDTDTFADGTRHKLNFFYLERGNSVSNLSLKFNFVTDPESDVVKLDQDGNPVEGAKFELYEADEAYGPQGDPICTGTTNAEGRMVFEDAQGSPVTMDDLESHGMKFLLREVDVPASYRSGNLDTHLYIYDGNGQKVLLSDNWVETGSYAAAKLRATIKTPAEGLDGTGVPNDTMYTDEQLAEGTVFAVVMQKYKGEATVEDVENYDNWRPVYGDPIDGWKVGDDNSIESIIEAVQALERPYIFKAGTTGAWQADIENLPGDIKRYYFMLPDKPDGSSGLSKKDAEYVVAYFFTEGTLDGAKKENTHRLSDESINRLFSTRVYVSDIVNRLIVEKVDDAGALVDGATFAVYTADDVEIAADGSAKAKDGARPIDSAVTGALSIAGGDAINAEAGTLVFPTKGKQLNLGEYYLVETAAPEGYKPNAKATKVVVDNSGVYADAGVSDDGISVERGVGSVARSMLQFTVDDQVDATLHDIKAHLEVSEEYAGTDTAWEDSGKPETHLRFVNPEAGKLGDYAPARDEDTLTLGTDSGWSKLAINQCLAHDESTNSPKQELGDADLVNLFSGSVTVRVVNERVGALEVSKKVEGDGADKNARFAFEVKSCGDADLSGAFDVALCDEASDKPAAIGTLAFANGKATSWTRDGAASPEPLALRDGQRFVIEGLALGSYIVSEAGVLDDDGTVLPGALGEYSTTHAVAGNAEESGRDASATVEMGETAHVGFVNYRIKPVDVPIAGTKALAGREGGVKDGEFSFDIEKVSFNGDASEGALAAMPLSAPSTVKNNAEGGFAFSSMRFTQAGDYVYRVSEVGGGKVKDGVTYDPTEYLVTVEVSDDGKGNLRSVVSYAVEGGGEAEAVKFENKYAADPAKGTIKGMKSLVVEDGTFDFKAGMFAFEVAKKSFDGKSDETALAAMPMPDVVKVDNKDDGGFEFGPIEFTQRGTYVYEVSELDSNLEGKKLPGVDYDHEPVTVTFVVDDNGQGQMVIKSTTYSKAGSSDDAEHAVFKNVLCKPGEISSTLSGWKTLVGATDVIEPPALAGGEFTFELNPSGDTLAAIDVGDVRLADGAKSLTAENDANGSFTFGDAAVTFYKTGEYVFAVTEQQGEDSTVDYDETEYTATARVTDKDAVDGETGKALLSVEWEIVDDGGKAVEGPDALAFENVYKPAPASVVISGTKALVAAGEGINAPALKGGEFSFELTQDGVVVDTAANDAEGTFSFDAIKYTEPDKYSYLVSEVSGSMDGVAYDKASFYAIVTVEDNGGKLEASVAYMTSTSEEAAGVSFTNTYEPAPVEVSLGAKKTLSGRDLRDAEFSFELRQGDAVLSTASNAADGTVLFAPVTFKRPGTYTFEISEVAGDAEGVAYDAAVHKVTVTVVDSGGKLEAEVAYEGGEVPTFANAYTPPEEPEKPEEPGEPEEPGTPDEPKTPGTPDEPGRPGAIVQTNDAGGALARMACAAGLIAAAFAVAGIVRLRRCR